MKKILGFLILVLCLFPTVVLATVTVYDRHVVFHYGLDGFEVGTERVNEDTNEAIFISGGDVSQMKIDGEIFSWNNEGKLMLLPGVASMNDYKFWKVTGENGEEEFVIIGYTIEVGGDTWLERNSLTSDAVLISLLIGFVVFAFFKIKPKDIA